MLRFTTDDIPAADRFDQWREVRGKGLFGVTIELAAEERAGFHGQFAAEAYGGAVVSELQASSYRVSRSLQDISRLSSDSLLIGWQVDGGGWMETGRRGSIHRVARGTLTVGHSEQAYSATPHGRQGFSFRMIKIPLAGWDLAGPSPADLAATPIDGYSPLLTPMTALFSAIAARDPSLTDPKADIDAVGRLSLMATGRLANHAPENRAALRTGLFHAARAIMRRDLGRPDLSPIAVAQALRISVRQLHILFEPSGLSFARTLTGFRLERVVELITSRPGLSIAEIAYGCGFDSLATFYRAFRASHGMTPLDMRAMPDAPMAKMTPLR